MDAFLRPLRWEVFAAAAPARRRFLPPGALVDFYQPFDLT
jgi:hypothetical protein